MYRRSWCRAPPSDDRQQQGQCILFSVVSTPSPPTQHCRVWLLLVIPLHCIAGADLPIHILGQVSSVILFSILFLFYRQVGDGISRFIFSMIPLAVM
jgi:hypothetical protein